MKKFMILFTTAALLLLIAPVVYAQCVDAGPACYNNGNQYENADNFGNNTTTSYGNPTDNSTLDPQTTTTSDDGCGGDNAPVTCPIAAAIGPFLGFDLQSAIDNAVTPPTDISTSPDFQPDPFTSGEGKLLEFRPPSSILDTPLTPEEIGTLGEAFNPIADAEGTIAGLIRTTDQAINDIGLVGKPFLVPQAASDVADVSVGGIGAGAPTITGAAILGTALGVAGMVLFNPSSASASDTLHGQVITTVPASVMNMQQSIPATVLYGGSYTACLTGLGRC